MSLPLLLSAHLCLEVVKLCALQRMMFELDQALYLWFVQQRWIGMPISGQIQCEKAK